ncbi:MAG: PucR family transcriptional regulator, purine catabolism regulatory protein [Chloroflexota bacterium]|jgi:purine catabolism regulator|nr:PucR family transcriptional regulator, purine catabolism regulatory protein [Chloroflexota bacterium]
MASLHDIHRALFPTARPVGGVELSVERGEREVGWVRVLKPRVPAFDALEAGDLALIPGPALALVAPGTAQIDELAVALARARVPAVLLVEGETGGDALEALGVATTTAGLTALQLGRVDPVGLERSVIGFLVNRRSELDRRAAELEAQLARFALLGRGLDVLAAAIGSFLGRAVVIEGRRGDPIAIHAPVDLPAAGAAVARYLARPSGGALRVEIPGAPGEPSAAGRLVLLGDEPPNELERISADRIAALLALELARDAAVRQARDETRRGDPLPADGPPWVVMLASQGIATGPDDIAAREETRGELRILMSPRRLILRGSSESLELRLVAAAPADDPAGLAIAERLAGFLDRTIAVSRPFNEPGARPAAEAAARATLEASELLPEPPRVVRAARLPAYLLLGNLRNLPDGTRQARELLGPILVGRAEVQRERLATLRAVVGSASLGEAATLLGVHRNTLAYRIGRLEKLADWDLSDPDLRFTLELAVRIVQNAQTSVVMVALNRNPTR